MRGGPIEGAFLSHWHYDHSGAIPEVIAAIAQAREAAGLPPPFADLHPDRPDQRGIMLPNGSLLMLPREPDFAAIEAAGAAVLHHRDPHPICGGFF